MKDSQNNMESIGKIMTRRQFLVSSIMLTSSALLASCGINLGGRSNMNASNSSSNELSGGVTESSVLEVTPSCGEEEGATPEVTEGPYFTPDSPERTSLLEQGIEGTKLSITGFVLTTDCKPVKHALVDFWHANDQGEYDNEGYTLRGHQYTDDKGRFTLQTIEPGIYTGRTRHIHVKVQAPNEKIVTTQLFFPNEAGNASDNIYQDVLLMKIRDNADISRSASFNFVVAVG